MSQLQQAYIINTQYIKENYSHYLDSNVDDNLIQSCILIAQDVNLQSNIGYNMWNFIITGLMSDPTGMTFSNQYQYLLVNYIYKSVALWTIHTAYPTLLYKNTNKAVVTKHSDDSKETGIRELEFMRTQVRNQAEFYDSRTVEYIKNFPNDYPEYYTTSGVDRIVPKSRNYFGGLYLGNVGRYRSTGSGRGSGCCGDGRGYQELNW